MPWSHLLPDYVAAHPTYGTNLVEVATALEHGNDAFAVVDIGANIGDSALEILQHTDARVLCVEGDPYWLAYLRRNVGTLDNIVVEPALLIPEDASATRQRAIRADGTTRFVAGAGPAMEAITAETLFRRHPEFRSADLVKCDTDGHDPALMPAIARALHPATPVLFFEYDPGMAMSVGNPAPENVFSALGELGYEWAAVWDNFGNSLGWRPLAAVAGEASVLALPSPERTYFYWDLAVVHADDQRSAVALRALAERSRDE